MDKNKLALTLIEIVAMRLDAHDQRIDGIWPPNTDLDKWKLRYRGTPPEDLPPNMVEINHFKIEVDDFVAALFWAISDAEEEDAQVEIERLRKENERLDFELGDKIGELGELGLEAEALREDAERWRKARSMMRLDWPDEDPSFWITLEHEFTCVPTNDRTQNEIINEAIDAARRGDE